MPITPISEAMNHLDKLHKNLLGLAYKKTELIKTGDMEGLDQLLKDEQKHVAAISQLESQRQQKVMEYLQAKGLAHAEPTVASVIEATDADEKEQIVLIRDELLRTINDLKWQNDLNQKLTYQSLQFVNLSLDMLRPRPESMNYSKDVIQRAKSSANNSFDSQA